MLWGARDSWGTRARDRVGQQLQPPARGRSRLATLGFGGLGALAAAAQPGPGHGARGAPDRLGASKGWYADLREDPDGQDHHPGGGAQ